MIGVIAGFFGSWVDLLLSKVIEVLFAFPDIFMALVIMSILGASITNLMIAIGIVYTPIFARIARGAVLEVKGALFIEVARSIGVNKWNIIKRHVLPNIRAVNRANHAFTGLCDSVRSGALEFSRPRRRTGYPVLGYFTQ